MIRCKKIFNAIIFNILLGKEDTCKKFELNHLIGNTLNIVLEMDFKSLYKLVKGVFCCFDFLQLP